MTLLTLDGVVKRYGAALGVGPVDFTVEEGEFLTLLGPSGCGKTTTLHVIAGLHQPDEGRVLMRGADITHVEPPQRDMGVVFQNYALFPHKTIAENVAFGLRMRRVARAEIAARVKRILDLVGLPGVEDRYPRQLSGGQQQRVAVARALVIEPNVLLLDEPLSNLDAQLRKRMRLELRAIQRRLGITAINVTHDQDEAFEMSDRVILMNRGRIEQIGTPEQIYDMPATRFAAEFIGEANLFEGRIAAAEGARIQVETAAGTRFDDVPDPGGLSVGDPVFLLVRPERVEIGVGAANGHALRGHVAERVFSGEQVSFTVETAAGLSFRAKKPSLDLYRGLAPGTAVWIEPADCRVVPREAAS